jgi:hypothetical protein
MEIPSGEKRAHLMDKAFDGQGQGRLPDKGSGWPDRFHLTLGRQMAEMAAFYDHWCS